VNCVSPTLKPPTLKPAETPETCLKPASRLVDMECAALANGFLHEMQPAPDLAAESHPGGPARLSAVEAAQYDQKP
jgi:hypothetical protein